MPERIKNNGLVYLRRSGSRQESSLATQLEWAIQAAKEHRVHLLASANDLEYMQNHKLHKYKGIRLDDAITGADNQRPGFVSLTKDLLEDENLTHAFIYRRDRFSRPREAAEMLMKEKQLSRRGITLIMVDKIIKPLEYGEQDFGRDFAAFFEYFQSGQYLDSLAENVIAAHRRLAQDGYSCGGRAPFGFVRVLVDARGQIVETLPDGKRVRQEGCHVRWIPGTSPEDQVKIKTWLHILELRANEWGYKRIANHLTDLEIPSPDAGRTRTDNGVEHAVPHRWNHTTVRDLCRNKTILGIKEYGRRSEGNHRRLSADGWRHLTLDDLNCDERPKTISNPDDVIVESSCPQSGPFDQGKWNEIQEMSNVRSSSQRGIPRSRDPAKYPLSCRIVDMTDGCGSFLYGIQSSGRKLYRCGRYQASGGKECNANGVDAEAIYQFALSSVGQMVATKLSRARH